MVGHGKASDTAFRSGQLLGVKSKLFASLMHQPSIDDPMRAAERNFRFSTAPMHRHHHPPFVPQMMLAMIYATALLHEPFSECSAFHRSSRNLLYELARDAQLSV